MVTGAPTKPDMYGTIANAYASVGLEPPTISVSVLNGVVYVIHVESGKESGKGKFFHDTYTIPLQGGIMRQALIPLVVQESGKEELEGMLLAARETVAIACGVRMIVAPFTGREGVVAEMFSRNGFYLENYQGEAVLMKRLTAPATN